MNPRHTMNETIALSPRFVTCRGQRFVRPVRRRTALRRAGDPASDYDQTT